MLFSAEKCRWLRTRKGITQKRLAEMIGCGVSTISGYEAGYRVPTPVMIKKIAEALEVTPDELAGIVVSEVREIPLISLQPDGVWEVSAVMCVAESDHCQLAVMTDASVSGTWKVGTRLLVSYGEKLVPEKFYLVQMKAANLRFVRKAIEINGAFTFVPTALGYRAFSEDEVDVIGRVTYSLKEE